MKTLLLLSDRQEVTTAFLAHEIVAGFVKIIGDGNFVLAIRINQTAKIQGIQGVGALDEIMLFEAG
jgi:hypothetical protein